MPPRRPRVLIVDDDAATARLLTRALKRRRLDVVTAADGSTAITALERRPWDVLVSDLLMPNVDGWKLLQWVAENPRHRPRSIIILSAAERDLLAALDPKLVNAIVFKPFDLSQLASYVTGAARLACDRRRGRTLKTI